MKEKMNLPKLTCERARSICIVETLAKLGHFPGRTTEKEAWFLSPLRSETQASFKVSLKLNRWYDFGLGKGGNVIDLVCLISDCSVREALRYLSDEISVFSFQQHQQDIQNDPYKNSIMEVKPITRKPLKRYLESRGISLSTARKYCREVWYKCNAKTYYAIGLENNEGGWELRNLYCKTSTSPKSYTYLKNHSNRLIILEGMFDLLSMTELFPDKLEKSDAIVLNSLSFLQPVSLLFKNYKGVDLYLDNDLPGNKYSKELIQNYSNIKDHSDSYIGYKDLNEKLVSFRCKEKLNTEIRLDR